ncbi:MAG: tRNA lysidine(34) synthetase TilS [Bdellovibrionales bacterium]
MQDVAVAVSGGPDSLALAYLLSQWAVVRGVRVHALTVDHGLRDGAAVEAAQTGDIVKDFPHMQHHILRWRDPAQRRIQEEARKARYALMAEYCREHDIRHLFLAHHRDDQAETVLFRLAKGSGLNGLCGMSPVQDYDDDLTLLRPLLDVDKADLVALCQAQGLSSCDDPSNENPDFARVRLRQARAVLEGEGLSAKRLSVTAKRMQRAREALDSLAEKAYQDSLKIKDTKRIEFCGLLLKDWPEEIVLRVVLSAMHDLGVIDGYAPRMERLEALVCDLIQSGAFRKRTLGGVVFARDDKADVISLCLE